MVAQSLGWLGNYFNQELFGGTVQAPVGPSTSRPGHHPPGRLQYSTFEPTFLYEIVWNPWLGGGVGEAWPSPQDPRAGYSPLRGRLRQ